MASSLSTDTVRFYATTNQTDESLSPRQREFRFDQWLDQIKKEAAAQARIETLDEVIKEVVSRRKLKSGSEPLSDYDVGRNSGLVTAYNVAFDLKNPSTV